MGHQCTTRHPKRGSNPTHAKQQAQAKPASSPHSLHAQTKAMVSHFCPLPNLEHHEDNGLPVHIKGGSTDVLLYRFTMTITIAGCGFSFYWLLVACQPRNK
ncbi:hypothetical protein Z043_117598 [Scleropages formosus]|uniref:Cytochrome c oxidase subunit 7A1, mitochondrial n=1 Tax=Scleropages formosus TaxID=113540 RepID=A0A0P7U8W0_SCLFO|nr:hypothetical protein Z043_117598 [Scleropages formosus]